MHQQRNGDTSRGLAPHQRPLPAIAQELRQEVEQAEQHWQSAVGHAIRAGELLAEAKSQTKHGEWLPWLEANFPGSERTARNYMRLAANSATVADLPTIREAVAAVAQPKELETGGGHDDLEARIEREAHAMVAEKNAGRDVGPLYEAEVCIQTALLWRRESARAALSLAAEYAASEPRYAAACADVAAILLDTDVDPWGERYDDVMDRWQVESANLKEAV